MAQALLTQKGQWREKRAPVTHLGFPDGEQSNVITVYAGDEVLCDIAYRPHKIGRGEEYDRHGLFICG